MTTDRIRVAVTGIGAVSGFGIGCSHLWNGLSQGQSAFSTIDVFDCSTQRTNIGAQVRGFQESDHFSRRERRLLSRCDTLAILALRDLMQVETLWKRPFDATRGGVVLGAGAGGTRSGEIYYRNRWQQKRSTKPSLLSSYTPAATTDVLANHSGFFGHRETVVTACSSSNTAIGRAADLIRGGICDFVLSGGSDGLSELTYSGFNALKALSLEPCRPFDRLRQGLSLGEGAGLLLLENWQHARNRGAKILGEFLGYGLSSDAHHMTAPDPKGRGAFLAMTRALQNAKMEASDIDYVSAHGTATPHNDVAEALALQGVFGNHEGICRVPTSSIKSMIGHCLGAAAAIEAVALILSLHHQWIPPTIHHEETDPLCKVDCVPNQGRKTRLRVVMSNSFAFGGNNTSIVVRGEPA